MRDNRGRTKEKDHEQDFLFQLPAMQKWSMPSQHYEAYNDRCKAAPNSYEGQQLLRQGSETSGHVLSRLHVYACKMRSVFDTDYSIQRLRGRTQEERFHNHPEAKELWIKPCELARLVSPMLPRRAFRTYHEVDAKSIEEMSSCKL